MFRWSIFMAMDLPVTINVCDRYFGCSIAMNKSSPATVPMFSIFGAVPSM